MLAFRSSSLPIRERGFAGEPEVLAALHDWLDALAKNGGEPGGAL